MAYIPAANRPQAGVPQALRGFWGSLGAGVALGLAILAFLVGFYNLGYQAFTDFRPIERLEFAAIDSPGSMAQFFVSPCSDGDSFFLFTISVKEKAVGAQ